MAIKHDESQKPINKKLSQTRRTALKKIALGGGVAAGGAALPSKWIQPLVDRVMVPAHAQTSREEEYFDNHSNNGKARTLDSGRFVMNATLVGNIVYLIFVGNPSTKQKTGSFTPAIGPSIENYRYKATVNIKTLFKAKMSPAANPTPPTGPSGPITVDKPGDGCFGGPTDLGNAHIDFFDGNKMKVWIQGEWFDLFSVNSLKDLEPLGCGSPSDIRLKTDIHPLGVTNQGFKLYRFRYIKDPAKHEYVGVMAQDLTDSHPHALVKNDNGYFAVRYDLLGLKMTTYKEWRQAGLNAVELVH